MDDAVAGTRPRDQALAERNEQLQEFARADGEGTPATDLAFGLPAQEPDADAGRSVTEYQARKQVAEAARNTQSQGARLREEGQSQSAETPASADMATDTLGGEPQGSVHTGPFTPYWLRNPGTDEPELLFIRVVRVDVTETLQGVWLDWPALREALLATSRDLLPEAALQPIMVENVTRPVAAASLADAGRLLAGVPAALVPGPLGEERIVGLTATRTVLLVAWLAVVAAVVAIGLVLRASLALSERRGRFVSAVTHELRTPLTTFCLYSQMLADGMVRDEVRRGEYLGTLRRESERLAGIVENVLAFARVGARGRRSDATLRVGELIADLGPSLQERTEQASMRLEIEVADAGDLEVAGDRGSVERVIVNLVDNACKYAAEAVDKRITLRVVPAGAGVEFRVRDRGPGVPNRERRRIFNPFVRARRHAGDGSSGLGLGLALARGVARSLGGDLRLARCGGPGAEFVLWMPRVI
jgi:signal transduction histidine kinase